MGQLVLLVVAAAWAAVLIPPLLRSRIENRPNSSVTDFRNQLSSLQRAMPSRGVAMRSMARPLAPSPLSRPAASGRPPMRAGIRTHGGQARSTAPQPVHRPIRHDGARLYDATPRVRSHGDRVPAARPVTRRPAATRVNSRDALKRRRANVLFVLVLVAACSLFLAATTKAEAMLYVFGVAFLALCGYVYVLGQIRQREQLQPQQQQPPSPPPVERRPAPHRHQRHTEVRRAAHRAPARRPADSWSHAV